MSEEGARADAAQEQAEKGQKKAHKEGILETERVEKKLKEAVTKYDAKYNKWVAELKRTNPEIFKFYEERARRIQEAARASLTKKREIAELQKRTAPEVRPFTNRSQEPITTSVPSPWPAFSQVSGPWYDPSFSKSKSKSFSKSKSKIRKFRKFWPYT